MSSDDTSMNPSSVSGVGPSDATTQTASGSSFTDGISYADGSAIPESERRNWIKTDRLPEELLATKPILAQIANYVKNQVKFTDKNYNTRFVSFHQAFVAAVQVFDAAFKELFVQVELKYRLFNNLTVTRYTAKNAVEQRILIGDEGTYPKLWDAFQALGGLLVPYSQARGEASREEIPEEHKPIWLKRCDGYQNLIWCARNILIKVANEIAEGTLTVDAVGGPVRWTSSWAPKDIFSSASGPPSLADDVSTVADSSDSGED
jgi:hypothetical protein